VDGNKRVGHAAMVSFLRLNGRRIEATVDETEQAILHVASGGLDRDGLQAWIEAHEVPASPSGRGRRYLDLGRSHALTTSSGRQAPWNQSAASQWPAARPRRALQRRRSHRHAGSPGSQGPGRRLDTSETRVEPGLTSWSTAASRPRVPSMRVANKRSCRGGKGCAGRRTGAWTTEPYSPSLT